MRSFLLFHSIMLLQLIVRNVEWYQFLINAFIVIIGRSLDIMSTRYVTKELFLETNKLARKLGWKGMILIQLPLVLLGSLDLYFALFIFMWSLFLSANNLEGSWYVKQVGEEEYKEELKEEVQNVKLSRLILGEISYILNFTISGILIIVFLFIYRDLVAIFFIALALICNGILSTVRSVLYLKELKKDDAEKE